MNPPLDIEAKFIISEGHDPTVGTPLTLQISATHAPGGIALLPKALDLPDEWGEQVGSRVHQRTLEDNVEVDTYTLQLIPFTSGILELPQIELALGETVAQTEPLLVTVVSTLSDEELQVASSTQPENLAILENMTAQNPPAAQVSVINPQPFWAGLGLIAALVFAILARYLYTRYQARVNQPPPPPPPRPAHEVALENLAQLTASKLLDEGAYNQFYTELSRILRTYLGQRYQFDAIERTLEELMDELRSRPTPQLDQTAVETLLAEADLAKFSKYQPPHDAAKAALNTTRRLVQTSKAEANIDTLPVERAHNEGVSQ